MRGREKYYKYRSFILALSKLYKIFPMAYRKRKLERIRKNTGYIAMARRYALLKTMVPVIGDNVSVFSDVYIHNPDQLRIGSNVSFQPMTYVEAYGSITIGDNVSIAEGASLFSVNHGYSDINIPIKDQELKKLPIVIENNVWIGAKAIILGGVTLSSGTIVAAGAVVHDSTEKNTIVAGVPAKTIRIRK